MNFPRKIQVGDKWYSVEVVEMLEEKRAAAHINYIDKHLVIGRANRTRKFTPGELNEAFWHELTHAILEDMGTQLCHNEKFVTGFSRRLARAVLSARME